MIGEGNLVAAKEVEEAVKRDRREPVIKEKYSPLQQIGLKHEAKLTCGQMEYVTKNIEQTINKPIFVTREEERIAENKLKPRATSFEVLDRETNEVLDVYEAPIEPEKPNVSNQKNQQQYKMEVQEFTEKLSPPFMEKQFPVFKETIQPQMRVIAEELKHIVAAALKDLPIKEFIQKHSELFEPGEISANILAYDGCDGFAGDLQKIFKVRLKSTKV